MQQSNCPFYLCVLFVNADSRDVCRHKKAVEVFQMNQFISFFKILLDARLNDF